MTDIKVIQILCCCYMKIKDLEEAQKELSDEKYEHNKLKFLMDNMFRIMHMDLNVGEIIEATLAKWIERTERGDTGPVGQD